MNNQQRFWFSKSLRENKVKYDLHLLELYAQSERLFGIDISGVGYKQKKTADSNLLQHKTHSQTYRPKFYA